MPNGVKKEHLPTKICLVCQRPFTWRKKWEKVWDDVSTCSKSCNGKRRALSQQANRLQAKDSCFAADDYQVFSNNRRSTDSTMTEITQDSTALPVFNSSFKTANVLDADQYDTQTAFVSTLDGGSSSDARSVGSAADDALETPETDRAARQAAKKRVKAERRAKREGHADDSVGQKECSVCAKSVDLLIRCTIDESQQWTMVCGRCWKDVSGGVVDGDANHPHYRYGGLWKNRTKRS